MININGPRGAKQLAKQNGVYTAHFGGGTNIPGVPGGGVTPDYLEPGAYPSITARVVAARMPSAPLM